MGTVAQLGRNIHLVDYSSMWDLHGVFLGKEYKRCMVINNFLCCSRKDLKKKR